MTKYVLFYFGADDTWEKLVASGFTRRNSNLLKAFSHNASIECVYNVTLASRWQWLRWIFSNSWANDSQVSDFFTAEFVPSFFPYSSAINRSINQKIFNYLEKKGQNKAISWCYWPKGYNQWKKNFAKGKMVFDADHNIVDDPHLSKEQRHHQIALLQQIEKDADLVVSSSRSMNAWFQNPEKTRLILNGVDIERFNNCRRIASSAPPVIGYLGSLSQWVEVSWLIQLAKKHPEWTFKIGGKDFKTEITAALSNLPNVKLCGHISFEKVPSFLGSIDVALSLYKPLPQLDVNSMKIYEYLCAHIPVVAISNHAHLDDDFNGLLDTGKSMDEIEVQISKNLEKPKGLKWQRDVDDFLNNSTWSIRAKEAVEIFNQL